MTNENTDIIQHTLKRLQEGIAGRLTEEEIKTSNPKAKVAVDFFTNDLLAKITKRTPAEVQNEYEEVVQFRVPSNWFQHLKKQLGWKWKHKDLTKIVHFECGWKYPKLVRHLNLKNDEYEKYVMLHSQTPWGEENSE